MNINKILIIFLLLINSAVFGYEKISIDAVKPEIPELKSTNCKFYQNKFLKTAKTSVKSSGNFYFTKNKEVKFETTYPIYTVSTYNVNDGKKISKILHSISNKNYNYLNKNFDIYKIQGGLDFRPKNEAGSINSLKIFYKNNLISKIIINSNEMENTIDFRGCKIK